MKALLVNGSPHKEGCTYMALKEVAGAMEAAGIETEIAWIGARPLSGCLGCRACFSTGKCVIDDGVNDLIDRVGDYDAFVFGTPVHFAGASGSLTSFMDRLFYARTHLFQGKPAAAIVSCRRGGATATFDQINKYFAISNMVIVGSQYWNMVHGDTPDEVIQDAEGMQTMRTLGTNMAWIMQCIEAGKQNGITYPGPEEPRVRTNYIR